MYEILMDILIEVKSASYAVLLLVSLIDIISGYLKAFYGHRLNSSVSAQGLIKHATMLIIPLLIHPVFAQIGIGEVYYTSFISLLIITNLTSILENYASMGLPYPDILNKLIDNEKLKVDIQSTKAQYDKDDKTTEDKK